MIFSTHEFDFAHKCVRRFLFFKNGSLDKIENSLREIKSNNSFNKFILGENSTRDAS